MLTNEDVQEIIDSWSFQTNLHIVANSLHIDDSEATGLLLDECLDRNIATPLNSLQQWKITYAAKDIIRNYYKDQYKNEDLINTLKVTQQPYSSGLDESLKDLNINYEELIAIIQASFPNKKTQQFVQSVLDVGATQTMEDLGLNRKQFNRRLKRACDYASHHRGKFTGAIDQQDKQKLTNELAILKHYELIINNRSSPELLIEELIENNYEYFEEFIGQIPNVDQCTLLRHYCLSDKKSMYRVNEAIYSRIQTIENKLDR